MSPITCRTVIVCLAGFFCAVTTAHAIEVGAAARDITPPLGVRMWGYYDRMAPSESVLDPLQAKAVVFDDGQTRAAIVSLDLGCTPPDDRVAWIRREAREKHQIEQMLLAATHTHAGPYFGSPDSQDAWIDVMSQTIVDTIGEAVANKQKAVFRVGSGEADISYDRRAVQPDGAVKMLWRDPGRSSKAPVDRTLQTVSILSESGAPAVTIVHYACHPVLGGGGNLRISADFPGALCAYVERELGGMCVYLQGACGEINPYMAGILTNDSGYETVIAEGETVGKEAVRAAAKSVSIPNDDLSIRTYNKQMPVGLRYAFDDERIQKVINGLYSKSWIERFAASSEKQFQADTSIIALGNQLAWAGFPGEFFDDFQQELRFRSPVPNTFFVGYCNGYLSYFPTIQAAAEGGYGADYGLLTEVGAGERLVNEAIIGLYELLGQFD